MVAGPQISPGETRIAGRVADGWIIGNRLFQPALLITRTQAWTVPGATLETLDCAGWPELQDVDLLLLGTGVTLCRPAAAFIAAAGLRGWRVEAMDSAAAARTFNVLVAEERQVGALIL